MVVSALYILDNKGKVLIHRNYRGDVETSAIEKFMPIAMEKEEEGKFEEESIRDNFVITYELLDEIMDFGYPQTTDTKILQEYITQESHKLEIAPRPPVAVTNAVSWRSENVKYRKNEVFLDVVESVNLLVSSSGNVLRSEIVGSIKLRVYLSGMPELRLGVNDKVRFENIGQDVKFHQCVRLSRFENDRTISFIPPDGEFELMSYRLNTHVICSPYSVSELFMYYHGIFRITFQCRKQLNEFYFLTI
ncbi:unnamed protein product [Trichobilharzia regenti]|nr:unnamed protein product [Trichobilharzia regenti]